jgi:integration host factor subunit beta
VTKSELVQAVARSTDALTRKNAEAVVNTIFEAMSAALQQGDRIEIRGFGSFVVRTRPQRSARNPRTGAAVRISERRVPFFKVGKELRERVNAGG